VSTVVTLALPFFGLIFLGYGIGRLGLVPAGGLVGLNVLVLYLALPALFFKLIAETPIADLTNWSFVLTAAFATYCTFAIAFTLAAFRNGGNIPEATIQGLAGAYSNSGYMAPGLTLAAFGAAAATPTALVFCFDNALLFILTPVMMAVGGAESGTAADLARNLARRVLLHPFILATLLGVIAAATGFVPPGPLDQLLTLLSGAAAPCALFALGLTVALRPVKRVPDELPVLVFVKLFVHPAIVYVLLSWVGNFDDVWMYTAVLMAALPQAANVYVLASQYGAYVERASTTILVGTVASIVTVTALLWLMSSGVLPPDLFP
jgi:predicted permease